MKHEGARGLPTTSQFVARGAPTPTVPIQIGEAAPPVWCKLEFMNPSGSTKDRVAAHILLKAHREGALRPESTVVEASSGSTSIAMALVCAQLGVRFVAGRMLIEIPFIVVAFTLPFFGEGARVDVLGIALSVEGLWDMWNIVAKATLGLLTSVILAGTTQIADLLAGFDRLRMPAVITSIAGFMIRYLDVVLGEFRRMRIALRSRGYEPRWLGDLQPMGQSFGTMFVRSYERGERVYLAMASRGYRGTMPRMPGEVSPSPTAWVGALALPVVAWSLALAARFV